MLYSHEGTQVTIFRVLSASNPADHRAALAAQRMSPHPATSQARHRLGRDDGDQLAFVGDLAAGRVAEHPRRHPDLGTDRDRGLIEHGAQRRDASAKLLSRALGDTAAGAGRASPKISKGRPRA